MYSRSLLARNGLLLGRIYKLTSPVQCYVIMIVLHQSDQSECSPHDAPHRALVVCWYQSITSWETIFLINLLLSLAPWRSRLNRSFKYQKNIHIEDIPRYLLFDLTWRFFWKENVNIYISGGDIWKEKVVSAAGMKYRSAWPELVWISVSVIKTVA